MPFSSTHTIGIDKNRRRWCKCHTVHRDWSRTARWCRWSTCDSRSYSHCEQEIIYHKRENWLHTTNAKPLAHWHRKDAVPSRHVPPFMQLRSSSQLVG